MALLGNFSKQSREVIPVDINFNDTVGQRLITAITTTVEAPVGMTLVSQQFFGTTLQLYVSGGTSLVSYKWTLLTEITIGGRVIVVEDEFFVDVANT